MVEKFDSIVVGAGPAGISAAIVMARAGLNVMVVERSDTIGGKNVIGGVLYGHSLEELVPEFYKTAPVERHIIEHQYWLLTRESHSVINYRSQGFNLRYNGFSILRARFDPWYAGRAKEAGAVIITKTTVEDVIKENGKISGIRTDRGDAQCDVVIAADGVNSLISRNAGLHNEWKPQQIALAVKEVIALPRQRIEDRFNIRGEEGVAAMMLGSGPGMHAGFIYTNKESLSVGIGVRLIDVKESLKTPNDILEEFKAHPSIKPMIEGGETKEYSAHLIPEGGYKAVPPAYSDGLLVVGDAAMLVNIVGWEGANLAVTSGKLAGETVIQAKKTSDFSSKTLSSYRSRLEKSFILSDLRKYMNVPQFLGLNPHIFKTYPEILNQAMYLWHIVDGRTKAEKVREVKREIFSRRSRLGLLQDMIKAWRMLA